MTEQAEPTTEPETSKPVARVSGRDLAIRIARICDDKQARAIVVLHVEEAIQVTDYFVIVEGRNRRHINVLGETVAKELKQFGIHRIHASPIQDDHWVVLDYGPVVLHCMSPDARTFYDLENLWGECEEIPWKDESAAPPPDDDDDDDV